jgi:hypothetical protein
MKSTKNLHYNNYRSSCYAWCKHQRPDGQKMANKLRRAVWKRENVEELEDTVD